MRIKGSRQIPAAPDLVWDRLNDPAVLERCIAGCEAMEVTGDGEFVASLKLRFGPVSASFDGRLSLGNIIDNRSYTIAFEGLGGVAGFGRGIADVSLQSQDQETLLLYTVETQIGGKLARVSRPLFNMFARRMINDFFTRFETVVVDEIRGSETGAVS